MNLDRDALDRGIRQASTSSTNHLANLRGPWNGFLRAGSDESGPRRFGRVSVVRWWWGLLICASLAQAQGASSVTDRSRNLESTLELALYPPSNPERCVMLLVDPSPSLKSAEFASLLAAVLERQRDPGAKLALGVAIVGAKGKPLEPGADAAAILAAVKQALLRPTAGVRDVYAELRNVLPRLAGTKGRREILLVTLENGDIETRLEATIADLNQLKVRVNVIAREAYLSDGYWTGSGRYRVKAPKGTTPTGPDAAFIELPAGWLFQYTRVNEAAPSGFAMYGLSRVASATGGRIRVYSPPAAKHQCGAFVSCAFCEGDHSPPNEGFRAARLKSIQPLIGAREGVYKTAASDPYFLAVLEAWDAAARAKLLETRPSVRIAGDTLALERSTANQALQFRGSSPKRWVRDAKNAAGKADKIAKKLKSAIATATGGSDRYRSVAELTYMMLRITRLNLLYLAAYAKEAGPVQFAKRRSRTTPPELPVVAKGDRIAGLYTRDFSLCHGVQPFLKLHLPGGAALKKELQELDQEYRDFLRRNAHTPFALALSRMSINCFQPARLAKKGKRPARKTSGSGADSANTRPERGGRSSGGSGTTTSGGR